MEQKNNASEVTRLLAQIGQEVTVMQKVKHGYASVTRHETITHHYDALGCIYGKLSAQIGETTAIATIVQELEKNV